MHHMMQPMKIDHVCGIDVYHSPEFKAFCERFGIAHGLPTTTVTIKISTEEMTVAQEYRTGEVKAPVETTTLHNREVRTHAPPPKGDRLA